MSVEKRYVGGVIGLAATVISLYTVLQETGLSGRLEWGVMVGSTLVAAVAIGWYQGITRRARDSEATLVFGSLPAAVAFWAVHWGLFVLAIGGFDAAPGPGDISSVVPHAVVVGALGCVWLIAVLTVGVREELRPSYWHQQYRDGKLRASRDG